LRSPVFLLIKPAHAITRQDASPAPSHNPVRADKSPAPASVFAQWHRCPLRQHTEPSQQKQRLNIKYRRIIKQLVRLANPFMLARPLRDPEDARRPAPAHVHPYRDMDVSSPSHHQNHPSGKKSPGWGTSALCW